MKPVHTITGRAYPLGRDNVDTDLILPARFLKTITRTGLGIAAFEPIRAEPDNVFTDPACVGAPILIAGENFGCGSSREHAVWAMMDFGIRAVIATGFSDIFSGNAFKNGLLAIALPPDQVGILLDAAHERTVVIDLPSQTITPHGLGSMQFSIDPFRKNCLLKGLDEIGVTIKLETQIAAYEGRRFATHCWRDAMLRPSHG